MQERSRLRFVLVSALAISTLVACAPSVVAQIYSTAIPDIGHDTSPILAGLSGVNPPSCPQQAPQLLPNSTGIAIDQNFCGYTPAPSTPICTTCAIASDDSGAVGTNHYVQTENYSAAIFDKSGNTILGPFPTPTFWSGFSYANGVCTAGLSDVVVLWDHAAQRWFVSKFAALKNADNTTSWFQCFAISSSTDPTGRYYRYVFPIDPKNWNDYPKFGIWPDAYYMTANNRGDVSNPTAPIAHFIVAFERGQMLAGLPAQEIIFKIDNNGLQAHLLPADWDGKTPPPPSSPNYVVRPLDSNLGWPISALEVWTVQTDWVSGVGVLNLEDQLTPDQFDTTLCSLSQNCIPQPGTAQGLDPLAFGMVMYRLAYRNFGDHESLVFTQTVKAGDLDNHAAIRWYELRRSGGSWSIFQQNTFAPNADSRWMGSTAMDNAGNMAMGYNASSSAVFPEIRIAGRLASDAPGTISEAAVLEPGLGSETGTVFFADYSQITLDPLDDCTFWYTGTYQPANATDEQFSWATKIGSFRFPSCVTDLAVTKTVFPSGVIAAGTNVTYTVTVTNNGPNDAGNITMSDNVPQGTGFVSITPPAGWNCTAPLTGKSGPISCKTTSLVNGAKATFTIVVAVNCSTPDGTIITNAASATAQPPPDNNHNNDSQSASFTVSNPVPVVTESIALSLLPQNNHDLVNVGLAASATDGPCPAPTNLPLQVFGNEDDQTPTDGQGTVFSPDAKDIAVTTLRLRQERIDSGNGRVYLLIVKATDAAGGTGFASLTVVVPKSSSATDLAAVNTLAAGAKAYADSHQGAPPAGYFVIGDGPIIGSKQ